MCVVGADGNKLDAIMVYDCLSFYMLLGSFVALVFVRCAIRCWMNYITMRTRALHVGAWVGEMGVVTRCECSPRSIATRTPCFFQFD